MENVTYDLEKLSKISDLNCDVAIKSVSGIDLLYEKLESFIREAKKYLTGYSSVAIVSSEKIQKEFYAELDELQQKFSTLGILASISLLSDLRISVIKNEPKGLNDSIQVFQAIMNLLAKKIASARSPAIDVTTYEEIKILIVDDMPEILQSIEGILGSRYKSILVTNGADALDAVKANKPSLFLLDVEMPEMNGFELAAKLREQSAFRKTPIIFLTNYATREYVLTARKIGNCDYLLKPADKHPFLEKIEKTFVELGMLMG